MQTYLFAIVKGDLASVTEAARERGLTVDHECKPVRARPPMQKELTVRFADTPENYSALVRWFAEPDETPPRGGYPPGTMLFYGRDYEP